jgi:hypothetical protein
VPLLLDPPTSTYSSTPPQRPSLHLPTTLSWTSDATRRLEYAKIDRAHSGLRGFCRRFLPKSCFGAPSRRNFWNERADYRSREGREGGYDDDVDDDDDDADSVRRYRLELPETEGEERGVSEKDMLKTSAVSRRVVEGRSTRHTGRTLSCF